MSGLTFHDFGALTGDRLGKFDVPCPFCSHIHNPRRRTLRIWRETKSFLSYHCVRCGKAGWAREGRSIAGPLPEQLATVRQETAARDVQERAVSLRKARWLWRLRQPVEAVSAARVYVRESRAYQGPIPPTLGALPAVRDHPPTLIAAFGLVKEPEPGVIFIENSAVQGVHLIKLLPDGRDRVRNDGGKITIGRGSTGFPIILAPPNDLLGLAITEGIENALSVHAATGLGAWAAGGASRLPALAAAVPPWINTVTIVADADPDGLRHARVLSARLTERHINTEVRIVGKGSVAA